MKKISKIIAIVLILMVFIISVGDIFAVRLPEKVDYDPNNVTSDSVKTKANSLMGTFVFLVQVACVVTMIFMGLRYMLASAEGKANVKKDLVVWCVGAVLVFGATTLIGLVLNVVIGDKQYVEVKPIEKSEEQIKKENEKVVSEWAMDEWQAAKDPKVNLVPSSIKNKPGATITRGEFAECLYLLAGKLGINLDGTTTVYQVTDIKNVSVKKKVQVLVNLGIVRGTSESGNSVEFEPDGTITREQVATLLHRTLQKAGKVDPSYEGTGSEKYADVSGWAKPSMEFMNNSGFIKGDEHGNLNPQGTTTCEEAILMIYRIYKAY